MGSLLVSWEEMDTLLRIKGQKRETFVSTNSSASAFYGKEIN
jgi:hypothetical protein